MISSKSNGQGGRKSATTGEGGRRMRGIGRVLTAVGVLLSVATVAAGCGGNGTSEDGHILLTKAQFVAKGDRICQRNYAKRGRVLLGYLAKAERRGAPLPQAQQEVLLVNRIMPIFREESEELDELSLPTNEAHRAETILAALDAAIAAVESEPEVAVKKGTAVQFARVEGLARSYGFKYCGRS